MTRRRTVLVLLALAVTFLASASAGAAWLLQPDGNQHPATVVAFIVAMGAMGVGLIRGGVRGYPFWFAFVVGYPALTPYLVQVVLGYPYISARQPNLLQTPSALSVPVLIAAAASLVLGLTIRRGSAPPGRRNQRPVLPGLPLLLLVSALCMGFSAWLAEPGLPLGLVASYKVILASRIPDTNFAGGAWVVFACLGMMVSQWASSSGWSARVARIAFYLVLVLSILWLLLHARRSEVAGLIPFFLFTYGARFRLYRLLFALVPLVVLLGLVGYVRPSGSGTNPRASEYVQLPGAPGNVLLTWVGAYELHVSGEQPFGPGRTYLSLAQNTPPRLLHLPRAPELKDYVAEAFGSLHNAGQYVLGDPFANFGYPGIVVFLGVISLLASLAVRTVQRFQESSRVNLVTTLIAADFLVLLFRTGWYGLDALVSGTLMALLVGVSASAYLAVSAGLSGLADELDHGSQAS